MSFFSDLGSFLGDVHEFSEQIDNVKQQAVSSVVDAVTQGKQVTDQVAADATDTTDSIRNIATDTVSDIKQTFTDNK